MCVKIGMVGKVVNGVKCLREVEPYISPKGQKQARYEFECPRCGKVFTARGYSIRQGKTRSCGCLHDDMARERGKRLLETHGMFGTPLYIRWNAMCQRAISQYKSSEHGAYADKGIEVCEEWRVFENFMDWALIHGYFEGASLERIDNTKGYCPENCMWIDKRLQAENRTTTTYLPTGKSLIRECKRLGLVVTGGSDKGAYRRISETLRDGKLPYELLKSYEDNDQRGLNELLEASKRAGLRITTYTKRRLGWL